jgi:hypothetical protein
MLLDFTAMHVPIPGSSTSSQQHKHCLRYFASSLTSLQRKSCQFLATVLPPRYTQSHIPFSRRAVRQGALGHRWSDRAATWQRSRQSRDGRWPHRRAVIVAERGGCGPPQRGSASPAASWCQDVRMPTVPCSPPCLRLPRQRLRVQRLPRPVSAHPVSGVRCVCPASARPVSSVRCPPVQCPVRASGICASASVSTFSAPVSSWSAAAGRRPHGWGGPGSAWSPAV